MFSRMFSCFRTGAVLSDPLLNETSDVEMSDISVFEGVEESIPWSERSSSEVLFGLHFILSRDPNYCTQDDAHALREMAALFEQELTRREKIQKITNYTFILGYVMTLAMFVLTLSYSAIQVSLVKDHLNQRGCKGDYIDSDLWFTCKDASEYGDIDADEERCLEDCQGYYDEFYFAMKIMLGILGGSVGVLLMSAFALYCGSSLCGTAFLGHNIGELKEKRDKANGKASDIEAALRVNFNSIRQEKCTYVYNGMNIDPQLLKCPITLEIMSQPVINAVGQTYERKAIEQWYCANNTDPNTRALVSHKGLVTNYALKKVISFLFKEEKVAEETKTEEDTLMNMAHV